MSERKLRWGLLSTARINRALIPPLRASARNRVTAVASRDQAKGEAYALRLDVEKALSLAGKELRWEDAARGAFIATPAIFGDVVLARKDTPASYHLAVVLDDARQGITLVTRGEDLLCEGRTVVACVNRQGRVQRLPNWLHSDGAPAQGEPTTE